MNIFYRYEDIQYEDGVRVHEVIYNLIKETLCGWWIQVNHDYPFSSSSWQEKPRWVSKASRKRLAYPTRQEAIKGFLARKARQISIYKYRMEQAEEAWQIGNTYLKYQKEGKEIDISRI